MLSCTKAKVMAISAIDIGYDSYKEYTYELMKLLWKRVSRKYIPVEKTYDQGAWMRR